MIGLATIFAVFKVLGVFGVGLFLLWLVLNGVLWAIRVFADRMGIDLGDHWQWFRNKLPEIHWRKKPVKIISEEKGEKENVSNV